MNFLINSTGNRIVADLAFMQANHLNDFTQLPDDVPPPAPPDPYEWLIDVGPFFDRFGAAKMAVLTSTDAGVQAIIRDASIRKWITLNRSDVALSLAYIGSKVPSVNAEMQAAIVSNPVQSIENIALRNTKVFG